MSKEQAWEPGLPGTRVLSVFVDMNFKSSEVQALSISHIYQLCSCLSQKISDNIISPQSEYQSTDSYQS